MVLALCAAWVSWTVTILYSMLVGWCGKGTIDLLLLSICCIGGIVLSLVAAAPDILKWYREAVEKCK